jgi:DNA primase
VASSGTALSYPQVKLLKRYTNNFLLCFDTDQAGQEAAKRAIELALPEEINIKMIIIKEAKDPDECIRKNPELWKKAIQEAVPFLNYYLETYLQTYDRQTLEGQKEICAHLLPLIKKFPNQIEQNFYLKLVAEKLNLNIQILQSELTRIKTEHNLPTNNPHFFPQNKYSIEEYLLGILINFPQFCKEAINHLIPALFTTDKIKNIYKIIENTYNNQEDSVCLDNVDPENIERYNVLSVLLEEKYVDFSKENILKEIISFVYQINKKNLNHMQEKIIIDLKKSQANKEEEKIILNKYNQLLKIKLS